MNNNSNKPIALVLGGTFPHITLIEKLKKRGYYTILIDYLPNPPAKTYSDDHIQESTLDYQMVLSIAKKKNASIIISACLDQPIPLLAKISSELGLPCYLSESTSIAVTNKLIMKNIFKKNGIPSSDWTIISKEKPTFNELKYPVIAKNISGTGSLGVVIIDDQKAFSSLIKKTYFSTNCNQIIVEEYKTGRELSIDAIVINKKSYVLVIRERYKVFINDNSEVICNGSIAPADISKEQEKTLVILTQRIANAFSLVNSPLMIQLIISNNNEISVLEIAARLGGGMSSLIIELKLDYNIFDAIISCYLNQKIDKPKKVDNNYYVSAFVYSKEGIIGQYFGFNTLLNEGIAEKINLLKKPGDTVSNQISVKNRVAEIVLKAKSKEILKEKLDVTFEKIDVLSNKNNSLMIKDFGINLSI